MSSENQPQSRLFEDATPVSGSLDSYLREEYELIDSDDHDTTAWQSAADTEANTNRPVTWLLGRKAHRAAIQYAISELTSDDPDLRYHSKSALAEKMVVSRQAVAPLLPNLAKAGIFKTKGNKRLRYAVNEDSNVLRLLIAADREVAAKFDD